MKLATLRLPRRTTAARIDGDHAVEIGRPDVGALLTDPGWRDVAAAADGPRHPLSTADLAPVVPRPGKIICVGLNYRNHILEMGRELPQYPTVFAKFAEALIGPYDDIVLPAASQTMDWEAELAVIIGAPARHVSPEQAPACIAGYSVFNDVTARDYQTRTTQWLQGKTFEGSTPFGPYLVTPDELAGEPMTMHCEVDGEVMQQADIDDLVFSPAELIAYLSEILTLQPGDVIATGTPGGVGHARKPPRYLADGSKVVTRISGIGELVNMARRRG
ncbi:fumarylacetoacetate hydrolase family protein [Nonomuraea basaltis]|uniref:fumarylacetoacetate hydrolase family protein n=1 Tax=Nonomuraea basaltis TaxID=2495887 RepID=UPI00110C49EE|nr:fumarylacetoacetate hydrolase family protein [Nonomuraea basaltis]TMR90232.1 fumarylacetoacetate hydrolase family protein [Nonomuraea basaltis]